MDGSVQPYALTLPEGVEPRAAKRFPLHVKLHGRAAQMNEVNFIQRHDGKPLPEGQDWVQLDVFGRTNNAYRWSGETDVFEALSDVGRTVRVDSRRTTLWGFSMGGGRRVASRPASSVAVVVGRSRRRVRRLLQVPKADGATSAPPAQVAADLRFH